MLSSEAKMLLYVSLLSGAHKHCSLYKYFLEVLTVQERLKISRCLFHFSSIFWHFSIYVFTGFVLHW